MMEPDDLVGKVVRDYRLDENGKLVSLILFNVLGEVIEIQASFRIDGKQFKPYLRIE